MKKIITFFAFSLLIAMISLANAAAESPLELNKRAVTSFYDELINQKNFDAASVYMGTRYIQHNPLAADGAEGLKNYVKYLQDHYPSSHSEIKQVFAEGNFVILHVLSILEPGTRGRAILDIFRLENGKIVEHWDVIQEIPEKSANDNGMF